ncbi:hypothetical protein [Pedobacter antarcticus]|uniref:hypothetical protein n=1 Tax=Pedobacter antarcticus TaxID=34086 RepID=UPI002930A509|nr:hypothetical protein [Pedobacter antarcticus]
MNNHNLYPWCDSGLLLLQNINAIIQKNGGREVMLKIVQAELSQTVFHREKSKLQEAISRMVELKIPRAQAADMLNISITQYKAELSKMRHNKTPYSHLNLG